MQANCSKGERDSKVELKCCVCAVLPLPSPLSKTSVYPLLSSHPACGNENAPGEAFVQDPARFLFLVSVYPKPMQIVYEVSCVKARIVEMLIQYNCWTDLVWFCTVVL